MDSIELANIESKYDFFICGSDQIWNGSISNLDPAYFLNFVKNSEKKKSYAASFGFEKVPKEMEEEYKTLLSNFSSINMREASGVKIVSSLLGESSQIVLDPTMLLDVEEWNDVAEEKTRNNKYILIYQVGMSSFLLKKAKEIARLTGLRVLTVPFPIGGLIKTGINMSAGPQKWIGLIKNAELVITDSFHGSAFSIMYNKRFFVCLSEGSTRIRNLLNTFNLNSALLLPGVGLSIDYKVDWSEVNSVLSIERQRSKDILSDMFHAK
jgi:exopolysaccharide biosynthesis predicted pyruvyltransferase EpsI